MLRLNDTIAAIATPPGEGGIGIVRVSGPAAFAIADAIFRTRAGLPSSLPSRTIHYGAIVEPPPGGEEEKRRGGEGERARRLSRESRVESREKHPDAQRPTPNAQRLTPVDDALLLLFRAPRSYTGEDVVEFSCHGGPVTVGRVLALTLKMGARLAEPGEFTQRAFLNGKMDLAQAEAVCDQIRARTEAAQRIALRQREGSISRAVTALKNDLVGALAAVEVTIDFSEEVGDLDYEEMAERLERLRAGIEALIATAERGRVYREGIRLAIVGRPNVGKSSLLNALLRENRAIVTPIAGTTRDIIEETANIKGIPLIAIDMAGLRETEDVVERIGVERAKAAIESASLLLFVLEASAGWTEEDAFIAAQIAGRRAVWAINKADLLPQEEERLSRLFEEKAGGAPVRLVSALTGEGLHELEGTLAQVILSGGTGEGEGVLVSNVRHLHALEAARDSLLEAEKTTAALLPPDFISIDLRAALDALGQITGETATEEIIHRIFHDFCIGK